MCLPRQKKLIPAEVEKHLLKRNISSYALIGCKTTERSYPCCEYDILVDLRDNTTKHEAIGSTLVDLIPIPDRPDETDLFNFLQMNTVMDPNLILSKLIKKDAAKKIGRDFALSRLLEAVSAIKKAEVCLSEKNPVDASFWVHTAGYGLAEAVIAFVHGSVHPAHLLDDAKTAFPTAGASPENLADAINLQEAGRTSIERRLEGINGLMLSSLELLEGSPESIFVYSKQLNAKVTWFLKNHAVIQAYCFLGWQATAMLRSIYSEFCKDMAIPPHHNRIVTELLERGERPYRIQQESFRLMGIRNDSGISSVVSGLRRLTESVKDSITSERS